MSASDITALVVIGAAFALFLCATLLPIRPSSSDHEPPPLPEGSLKRRPF